MTSENIKTWAAVVGMVAPLFTWSLVIIGWKFISADNNYREERREIRSAIDSIIDDIQDIETKAHEYYLTASTDQQSAAFQVQLKRRQNAMEARIKRLRIATGHFKEFDKIHEFKNAVTGGTFEAADRQAISPSHEKLGAISQAANELINQLDTEYTEMFKMPSKQWWQVWRSKSYYEAKP